MSNNEKARSGLLFGFIGFLLATALVIVPYFSRIGAFAPIPYRVTKSEWALKDRYIIAKVTFWKDKCVFDKAIARGIFFDEVDPQLIPIRDMDDNFVDLLVGLQTVRVRIGPLMRDYETIEIRTRHLCDGKKVDRVFMRMELP